MDKKETHQGEEKAEEALRPLADEGIEAVSGGMVITPPWVKGVGGRVEEDPWYKE